MTHLRIAGVPEHFNYPWELAAQEGLYQKLGLKLSFQEVPGGTGAMCSALAKREVHAALLLTEGAVLDVLRGSGNRLLKVYVSTPLEWGIHVPAASSIKDPRELAGRTVAISREGSGSHLIDRPSGPPVQTAQRHPVQAAVRKAPVTRRARCGRAAAAAGGATG